MKRNPRVTAYKATCANYNKNTLDSGISSRKKKWNGL